MIAYLNVTNASNLCICVLDGYDHRAALKAGGYNFSRDAPVDGWGAPAPKIIGRGSSKSLADPCHPCWTKTAAPAAAQAEVDALEAAGAVLAGDIGLIIRERRGEALAAKRADDWSSGIIAGLPDTPWTPDQWMMALRICPGLKAS